MKTQAERIFLKFGGVPKLHKAFVAAGFPCHVSRLYRWDIPKETGGTGGVVPSSAIPQLTVVARREGVHLTSEDLDPRRL